MFVFLCLDYFTWPSVLRFRSHRCCAMTQSPLFKAKLYDMWNCSLHCIFIYPPMGAWGTFNFCLLWIMLLKSYSNYSFQNSSSRTSRQNLKQVRQTPSPSCSPTYRPFLTFGETTTLLISMNATLCISPNIVYPCQHLYFLFPSSILPNGWEETLLFPGQNQTRHYSWFKKNNLTIFWSLKS